MRVVLENCGVVRKADVEFKAGLNVIKGESGSGKSTLLRAIHILTFNTSGDAWVTQGESQGSIEVHYNGHVIKRTRTINKSSSTTVYDLDGEKLCKVGSSRVEQVLNALSIKELPYSPNFLPQFATPFLIGESPKSVFDYISITSKASNLKDVEASISEDLSNSKQDLKIKDGLYNELNKQNEKYRTIVSNDDIQNEMIELLDTARLSSGKASKLQNILNNIDKISDRIEQIQFLIDKFSSIPNVSESINGLQQIIEKESFLSRSIFDYDTILKKQSHTGKVIKELERIAPIQIGNIDQEIRGVIRLTELSSKVKNMSNRQNALYAKIKLADEFSKKYLADGVFKSAEDKISRLPELSHLLNVTEDKIISLKKTEDAGKTANVSVKSAQTKFEAFRSQSETTLVLMEIQGIIDRLNVPASKIIEVANMIK